MIQRLSITKRIWGCETCWQWRHDSMLWLYLCCSVFTGWEALDTPDSGRMWYNILIFTFICLARVEKTESRNLEHKGFRITLQEIPSYSENRYFIDLKFWLAIQILMPVLCSFLFKFHNFLLRFEILELWNRVTKPSYAKWRYTPSY